MPKETGDCVAAQKELDWDREWKKLPHMVLCVCVDLLLQDYIQLSMK